MNEDRRNPIQALRDEDLRSFLRGRRVLSSHLYASGKSNSNYKLELDDGTACVARLCATPRREAGVMDLARRLVPVPKVFHEGPRLLVMEWIGGQMLADTPELVGQAASLIGRLSSRTFPTAGLLNEGGLAEPYDFGGLGGFIATSLQRAEVIDRLGAERLKVLRRLLANQAPLLAELDSETCLVHGDLNPTNVLLQESRVGALIDWEFSMSGTPYIDVGNLLRHTPEHLHDDIGHGLQEGGFPLPSDWKLRARMADLASLLEFLTSNRSEAFKRGCVKKLDDFLAESGP